MFLALSAIATHLRSAPHFQSWSVRDGLTAESRQDFPAVDVRYEGASVGDAKGTSSVNVTPLVIVSLIVRRGADAAAMLDAAFAEAIESLHGFKVQGATATRDKWTELTLVRVTVFEPQDGQVACQLAFTHSKRFAVGKCCAC